MNKNKIGISGVVENVMIVALTIIALAVLAQIVVPFVKDNLHKSSECLNYEQYFKFDDSFNYNCKNESVGYLISVKAQGDKGLESNIAGLKLVLYSGAKIVPLEVRDNVAVSPTFYMVDKSKLKFAVPKTGEIQSYAYNVNENFDKVEVYTLLKSGRTCETRNDEITLEACA